MILGFESLRAKINQASGEKCKNVILATYNKHIILLMLFVYFYSQYTVIMSMSKYAVIFIILYILVMLYLIFILLTNRVGIGMNDDRIIYVKFSRIGFKSKQVYCIDMDKIKYLDVRKILGNTNVKMSFIDGNGHLVKVNFRYTNKVFGLSGSEQKNNGKAIIDKLTELQKILDRGDF